MKIICVNGYARSGKDTFCNMAFFNRGLVYYYSTIDEVKKFAKILGWDGKKDEKGRKLLSDLKDCLTEYNDLPNKYVLAQIKRKLSIIIDPDNSIFLVQMREPKEIKQWCKNYNAKSLLIRRPAIEKKWGNHADDGVLTNEYDYTIYNDSTIEDLKEKTIDFIDKVRKEDWESYI